VKGLYWGMAWCNALGVVDMATLQKHVEQRLSVGTVQILMKQGNASRRK
jgi:hypothetical protein